MALTYSWNTITSSQSDADSPINETLMEGMRQNLIHNNEWIGKNYTPTEDHDHDGDNSAEIAVFPAATVGQGQLKTSSGIVSTTGSLNLTLPGGEYGFYPQVNQSAAGTVTAQIAVASSVGSYTTLIRLTEGGGVTALARQRYITASAPFNLGNGDIPLFVFAIIDNATGEVIATYSADTPPWMYNGRPENTFDPKKYKRKKGIVNYLYDRRMPYPQISEAGYAAWKIAMEAGPQYEEIEITPAMKNLDMDINPHPFIGNDLTGKSIVLLDPVGAMAEKMRDLHDMGESVADLLHGQYLLIDNEDAGAISPVGVKTHKVKWK